MPLMLMVTPGCCCIRARDGRILGRCSHCRAMEDPEFASRCMHDPDEKKRLAARARRKKTGRKGAKTRAKRR